MSLTESTRNFIVSCDPLQGLTQKANAYFKEHPNLYKAALLVDHAFRAFSAMLPFSIPVNLLICFAGSLVYRVTAEAHCPYKFVLPAFAGSVAMLTVVTALRYAIQGAAFSALNMAVVTLAALPLAAYATYVVLTVDHEVNKQSAKKCCAST
jgi:hypothetical protein